ncbi:response regulator [Noviherbaspirillum galbum]|uniref:Response regulator n=1 Tax=Noviherbaspirillum galbum TaxID=2709383 RepID=A0A6B3SWB1_9BURK|nr:response regulator [Noviherbaspirillum galbum]NEX63705.1 response regulator [Noviherbaspirillum galbum]
MTRKKVLIVDDNEPLCTTILELLSLRGFDGVAAYDGQEALQVLRVDENFGLILLDILMPVMDGMQFVENMRQEFPRLFESIPIVMLSAIADHITTPEWAKEKIKKPVTTSQLLEMVEQYCQGPA